MDAIPISPSKITRPRRKADLISRPRLLELFNDLLDYKLFIVAAPAGYGKTSLMVDFAENSSLKVCWYSLDPSDQDLQRFLFHLIASIQAQFPKFGKSTLAILNATTADKIEENKILPVLNNDLFMNVGEHFTVVLDDFHLVEGNKRINDFINSFLQEADENCHLIIASRTLLNLSDMPLFVAHSQVSGLSYAELAFGQDEIQKLFQQNNQIKLTEEEAEKLARETEGWITGLLLSSYLDRKGITDRLRVARISGVGLYDYLAQQVLNQQSLPLQRCLLRTSLLDEFDADICQDVINKALVINDDWGEWINTLLTRNLFIQPVGEEKVWFRYHHLFRDFLRSRMQRTYPFEAGRILSRLGEVHEREGEWEKAYQIYVQLKKDKQLPDLIERAAPSMLSKGRIEIVEQWLHALPILTINNRPPLLSIQGAAKVIHGRIENGLQDLQLAGKMLVGENYFLERIQNLIRLASTHRQHGDYQQAIEEANEVLHLIGKKKEFDIQKGDAHFILGVVRYFQGELNAALASFREAETIFEKHNRIQELISVKTQSATVQKGLGNFVKSENAYKDALEYCKATNNIVWQVSILNSLGIVQQLLGEYENAIVTFEKGLDYARIANLIRNQAYITASIADFYYEIGEISNAKEALRQTQLLLHQFEDRYLTSYINISHAEMFRSEGSWDQAQKSLETAMEIVRNGNSPGELERCNLENGMILATRGELDKAKPILEDARRFFKKTGAFQDDFKCLCYLTAIAASEGRISDCQELIGQTLKILGNPEYQIMAVSIMRLAGSFLVEWIESIGEKQFSSRIRDEMEQFEKRLSALRSLVATHAVSLPLTSRRISIRCMGKTQVRMAGKAITRKEWQTQIARDILIYLSLHPAGAKKELICEIFWPNTSQKDMNMRFKNTMYRIRRAVGKEIILYEDSIYSFNFSQDCEIDAVIFRDTVDAAKQSRNAEEKYRLFEEAVRMYHGDFLNDVDYEWAILEREHFRRIYIDTLITLSEYYYKIRKYELAQSYAQNAIKAEPGNEAGHQLAMKIYAGMKNKSGILKQFEKYKKITVDHLGNEVSPETRRLFDELSQ